MNGSVRVPQTYLKCMRFIGFTAQKCASSLRLAVLRERREGAPADST